MSSPAGSFRVLLLWDCFLRRKCQACRWPWAGLLPRYLFKAEVHFIFQFTEEIYTYDDTSQNVESSSTPRRHWSAQLDSGLVSVQVGKGLLPAPTWRGGVAPGGDRQEGTGQPGTHM